MNTKGVLWSTLYLLVGMIAGVVIDQQFLSSRNRPTVESFESAAVSRTAIQAPRRISDTLATALARQDPKEGVSLALSLPPGQLQSDSLRLAVAQWADCL